MTPPPSSEFDPGGDHGRPPDALNQALDHHLAQALGAPASPAGLHAAWRRAMAEAAAPEGARVRQRERLEAEHAHQLADLRSGYVRLRRDTLVMVLAIAFTAGAVAAWLVPWLRETQGVDVSVLLPLLAVAIGMAAGASVWVERFGLPRWRGR